MTINYPEKKVKQEIKDYLTARQIYFFMPVPTGYGRRVIPDFIVCYRGRFIALECKSDVGTTSAWQDRELAMIRGSGGVAVVCKAPVHLDVLKEALR